MAETRSKRIVKPCLSERDFQERGRISEWRRLREELQNQPHQQRRARGRGRGALHVRLDFRDDVGDCGR